MDLAFTSAIGLKALIAAKDISPVEAVEASLARARALQPSINAFVTFTEEEALQAARAAEAAAMGGEPPLPLQGVPISAKDLIAMAGVPFTFGSRSMADNVAREDAPSVARIKAAGAAIVGKTTTSEFGCKAVGDSPLTGVTRNPWNRSKTPGGSSAGAAASVAAGVTPLALGTDGGGSVRIPGSLTGLFAIKAQFGRVPVHPVSATPTLSHVGPMTRTVRDAALLLGVMAGFDARDPFAVAGPVPDFLAACGQGARGLRVAWSADLGYAEALPEVRGLCERAVLTLETLGCAVEAVDTVLPDDPYDLWRAEFYAGVGARLGAVLETAPETLDPAVARALGGARAQAMPDYYAKVFARYGLRERMRAFMEGYDLLASPTLPVPAFDTGLNAPPELPGTDIISWVRYTYPANLIGYPAATVPVGFTGDGLPVGLQLMSRSHREVDIFRAAAALEEALPWAGHKPPL